MASGISRREVVKAGIAGAAALALDPAGLVERAAAVEPGGCGRLSDIEHFVILVQENRSMDHYFGTLSGVRGFSDPRGRSPFFQKANGRTLHPFHLPTQCLPDLTHDWGPQHRAWNRGTMSQFLRAHAVGPGHDPAGVGVETMGYHTGADIPFLAALAQNYLTFNRYFASILGPTFPNRMFQWAAQTDRLGDDLTRREMEVLRLMSDGMTNHAIAEHLVVSVNTIRNHVQSVLEKRFILFLQVFDRRAHVLLFAFEFVTDAAHG